MAICLFSRTNMWMYRARRRLLLPQDTEKVYWRGRMDDGSVLEVELSIKQLHHIRAMQFPKESIVFIYIQIYFERVKLAEDS